jgi:hypothetical protein
MPSRNTVQAKATRRRLLDATKLICSNPGCSHRGEPQPEINFYKTNTETMNRYSMCKTCVGGMVNAEDLSTVYPILRDLNIAFMPLVWFENAAKTGKAAAFGKYLIMVHLGTIRKKSHPKTNAPFLNKLKINSSRPTQRKRRNPALTKSPPI